MKHKTLFRLMLKLLGVWILITGATSLLSMVSHLLVTLVSQQAMSRPYTSYYYSLASSLPGEMLQVAAGLYLFFGGRWIVDKAIPSNRPYCPECGYELTGAPTHICPECGVAFRAPDPRPAAGAPAGQTAIS